MTDTKQIPRAVLRNWQERQFCAQRTATIEAAATDIGRQIAEHEAYLKELRGQLAERGREHEQELADARWYEAFVRSWADAENDGIMPPPVEEVAMATTAANPVHTDPLSPSLTPCGESRHGSCAGVDCSCICHTADPLRTYPAAPTVPDGPYGGDGVEDARFHPRPDRHPGTGGPGGQRA